MLARYCTQDVHSHGLPEGTGYRKVNVRPFDRHHHWGAEKTDIEVAKNRG